MSIADAPARRGARIAISQAGAPITYIRVTDTVEDLDAGKVAAVKDAQTLTGVFTKVSWKLLQDSKVRRTDQALLIDAITFEEKYGAGEIPSTDDLIRHGGRTLSIVLVDPISSGEQFAAFRVVVRR